MIVGQGTIALAVGSGGGCLDIFTLFYPFSSFSLSLGDGPRPKYCLKGPLNPEQPTNQIGVSYNLDYSMERAYCACSRCGWGLFGFWMVGCFGLNGPLRQYFSLYRAFSQREGGRNEK